MTSFSVNSSYGLFRRKHGVHYSDETGKLYHVSACSDAVSATQATVFPGALGMSSSLTDTPWERLGPGVAVLDPVITHVKGGHSCWRSPRSLLVLGSKQAGQRTVSGRRSQQVPDEMAPHQPAASVRSVSALHHVSATSHPQDKLST